MADYYIGLAFDEWCGIDGREADWGYGGRPYDPRPPAPGIRAPKLKPAAPTDFPLITNV